MSNDNPIYSIGVPIHVLKDTNISATAKLLYGVIDSFQKKSGVCFASNDRLAEELGGCTPRTASKCVGELRTAGYIIIDDDKGRKIFLSTSFSGGQGGRSFLPPPAEEEPAQVEEKFVGGGRNFPPSNISSKKEKNKKEKPEPLTDEELRAAVVSGINGLAREDWSPAVKNDMFRWVMALYNPDRVVNKNHPARSKLSVDATFRKLSQSGSDPQVMIRMLCDAVEGGWQGVRVPEKFKSAAAKPVKEERQYRCL